MSFGVFCGQPLGFLREHSNFFEFFVSFVDSSFCGLLLLWTPPFVDSSFVDNGRMASTHYIVGFVPAAGRARVWEDASNIT